MSTASESELNGLHQIVAKGYVELLKGELSAANLSSAAKFLKDNAIILVAESEEAMDEAKRVYENTKFEDPEETSTIQFPAREA